MKTLKYHTNDKNVKDPIEPMETIHFQPIETEQILTNQNVCLHDVTKYYEPKIIHNPQVLAKLTRYF